MAQLRERVARWSPEQVSSVRDHLLTLGDQPQLYEAHPLCREVSRAWCQDAIPAVELRGLDQLQAALDLGPVLLVGNHLSYLDTQATDAALHRIGRADVADRIVALAGPKVYDDLFRRFAAACLSTLPVPQSTRFSHTRRIGVRELARRTRQGVDRTHALAQAGRLPLLYAEGSRSRDGRLGPFLRAAWRYTALEHLWLLPFAQWGTEGILPVQASLSQPGPVWLHFAEPIEVARHGPRQVLQVAHDRVAALLPPRHQPVEDSSPPPAGG